MSRLARCSLCDGTKHDEDGNRCRECNGLGFLPHWSDRQPSEIEEEIKSTEATLDLDIRERNRLIANEAEKGKEARSIAARMAEESMHFWTLKLEALREELKESRKRYP